MRLSPSDAWRCTKGLGKGCQLFAIPGSESRAGTGCRCWVFPGRKCSQKRIVAWGTFKPIDGARGLWGRSPLHRAGVVAHLQVFPSVHGDSPGTQRLGKAMEVLYTVVSPAPCTQPLPPFHQRMPACKRRFTSLGTLQR